MAKFPDGASGHRKIRGGDSNFHKTGKSHAPAKSQRFAVQIAVGNEKSKVVPGFDVSNYRTGRVNTTAPAIRSGDTWQHAVGSKLKMPVKLAREHASEMKPSAGDHINPHHMRAGMKELVRPMLKKGLPA